MPSKKISKKGAKGRLPRKVSQKGVPSKMSVHKRRLPRKKIAKKGCLAKNQQKGESQYSKKGCLEKNQQKGA